MRTCCCAERTATAKDSAETKAAAQEAYRAIRNGMDFEAAVKKYCTDEGLTLNGGKMDPFPSGRFEGDFMAPLYKTGENEITPPFETRYGWHIVKLDKVEKHDPPTYNESYEMLRNIYFQRNVEKMFQTWLKKKRSESKIDILL